MFSILLILAIIIINLGQLFAQYYRDECERNIYARCTHQSQFSELELENTRLYLQDHMRKADFPPTQPPCERLYVRKDIKCLTQSEKTEFVRVVRQMYLRGVMDRIADIHQRYWPETHKAAEFAVFHRWITHELEKEMRKISPEITLPYYAAQLDAAHPEKSIAWQMLGTTGVHDNGYCLTDGLYAGLNTNRCTRRQWSANGTIPAIDNLELISSFLQLTKTFNSINFYASGLHFITHLAFGGYRGDMSLDSAPYDITFFLWHNYLSAVGLMKKQLQHPSYATPSDYGPWSVDQKTGALVKANIATDRMTHYKVPVVDVYHVGFGELCSVSDQIVIAINQKINNKTTVPLAVRRLPLSVRQQFFPKFMTNRFDAFDHVFEEVGNCNRRCRPIPHFQRYVSTENGLRQLRRLAYDLNIRLDWALVLSQEFHSTLLTELNNSGYCSPYVTD